MNSRHGAPVFSRRRIPALFGLLILGCGALSDKDATGTLVTPAPSARATPAPPAAPQVGFPSVTVAIELAQTDEARTRGLGGHAPLGPRQGMLFIFERSEIHSFWMKGMTFPLDIMWIDRGRVVHLESDLPPCGPDETDSTRPVYTPKAPARYVLEVTAGFAKEYGIEPGTTVEILGVDGTGETQAVPRSTSRSDAPPAGGSWVLVDSAPSIKSIKSIKHQGPGMTRVASGLGGV